MCVSEIIDIAYSGNIWIALYKEVSTHAVLYEDNTACIAQLKGGYIEGDRVRTNFTKFFFIRFKKMHIGVQHIQSSVNLANLFTKLLPTSTFEKTADKIEIRRLEDLHKCLNEGELVYTILFFL